MDFYKIKSMENNKDTHKDDAEFLDETISNAEENFLEEENQEIENETKVQSSEELLAQEKDRYLRLYAEFENYKKRTSKEKMDFFQYANQDLMISMLDVLDDFERAMKNISDDADKSGVELIYQKLKNKLMEKGLKAMEVRAGDSFNVDLHEAITSIPAPSEELKGKIVDVIEIGYQLHDRVIRFAKVVTGN